jgi:hypothetical protein
MPLTSHEQRYYSIAESAATGEPVNGVMACRGCGGSGTQPSEEPFSSWGLVRAEAAGFAPVKYGVDACKRCSGTGVGR